MPRSMADIFLDVAGKGVGVVGQKEMRVVDNVPVAGILQRFRSPAR